MKICIDIEANGLLYEADTIWMICGVDDTMQWHIYLQNSGGSNGYDEALKKFIQFDDQVTWYHRIEDYLRLLRGAEKVIAHNLMGYDYPLLEKLHGLHLEPDQCVDTQIMSALVDPDIKGGHSLDAWGKRLGKPKGKHVEWDRISPEMFEYCLNDVDILDHLYIELVKQMPESTWGRALQIELPLAHIQARQELHGVMFDKEAAYDLVAELDDEIDCVSYKILRDMPQVLKVEEKDGSFCTRIFKKDGTYTKYICDHWEDPSVVWGIYSRISWHKMNLNSHAQVKDYLLSVGWQPTEWNTNDDGERTSPKLTEDSYGSIKGDLGQMIARRNVLMHRRNTIMNIKAPLEKGWIAQVRDDGRIEARAIPQATNTGRYRHSVVVNVPKAMESIPYGYQMRSLFTVPQGKYMMGCDASGLEARMEAHYCMKYTGGEEYAHELIDGDIHQKNADIWGCSRNDAKSPKYALTYGVQIPKLARTMGVPKAVAARYFEAFWESNTALKELKDTAEYYWEAHGFVPGLDGRRIMIRARHKIVNSLFQSGGSIVVKVATLFLNKWVRERGIDAHQVLHMHDEFQWEIWPRDEDIMRELAHKAFVEAGKFLKVKVPIVGDVQVGKNWAETH